jgi:hypothetical protein
MRANEVNLTPTSGFSRILLGIDLLELSSALCAKSEIDKAPQREVEVVDLDLPEHPETFSL